MSEEAGVHLAAEAAEEAAAARDLGRLAAVRKSAPARGRRAAVLGTALGVDCGDCKDV